jgi:class 3 adenylate cyclase
VAGGLTARAPKRTVRRKAAGAAAQPQRRVVVFVDIRGFTRLAAGAGSARWLPAFLHALYEDLDAVAARHGLDEPGRHHLKPLGDGAMLLFAGAQRPAQFLPRLLACVLEVEARFAARQRRLARARGLRLDGRLGWGVSRGEVLPVEGSLALGGEAPSARQRRRVLDHFGACINRAKRLCDKARPSGICIDQAAFPALPAHPAFPFRRRVLKGVKGIAEELPVWFCRVEPGRARRSARPR